VLAGWSEKTRNGNTLNICNKPVQKTIRKRQKSKLP